jgi:hypothetical protein
LIFEAELQSLFNRELRREKMEKLPTKQSTKQFQSSASALTHSVLPNLK